MIDPANIPAVESNEKLARYILASKHIRNSDNSIKPEAFVPYPHNELSVTRHRDASESELWSVGEWIAKTRERTLYGRGDVVVASLLELGLSVLADPILAGQDQPANPNHANVIGWPANDPAQQKLIALEVAARAVLVKQF